jgi:predicted transcriptional regulator
MFLQPMADSFSVEFARKLVELRAPPELQQRVDQLATKANEGTFTTEEQAEYKSFVDASAIVAICQAKAWQFLAQHAA